MTNEAILPTNSVVELRARRKHDTGFVAIAERSKGKATVRQSSSLPGLPARDIEEAARAVIVSFFDIRMTYFNTT
jgi:hypothetical protein